MIPEIQHVDLIYDADEARLAKLKNVVKLQQLQIAERMDVLISVDEFESALEFAANSVTAIFDGILPEIRQNHPELSSGVVTIIEKALADARNQLATIELPEKQALDFDLNALGINDADERIRPRPQFEMDLMSSDTAQTSE
jgi:phage terminase Nu1 subunit (DNA packaging protein)